MVKKLSSNCFSFLTQLYFTVSWQISKPYFLYCSDLLKIFQGLFFGTIYVYISNENSFLISFRIFFFIVILLLVVLLVYLLSAYLRRILLRLLVFFILFFALYNLNGSLIKVIGPVHL